MAEPSSDGFQVHPDDLSAAAAEARTAATRLTAPATCEAAGLSGWRTAAALRDCGEAWRDLLAALRTELADQAGKLDDTARHYRAGDRTATEAFLAPAGR
ncbi:hypothetical protein ACFYNO_19685 [Kitasatospora sp. NPDC006697]|uniref:hypothetical protein n=1 Tax=Kitasatospora sp. NPDC006697 TaxID=3364020 RepID=UPI0036AF87B6